MNELGYLDEDMNNTILKYRFWGSSLGYSKISSLIRSYNDKAVKYNDLKFWWMRKKPKFHEMARRQRIR